MGHELKICEFNVENLFIGMDYYRGQDLASMDERTWREQALAQFQLRQKPLAKIWGVVQTITEIDPDILMLIEVGSRDSLDNLNRHFLGSRFIPYFVEGNSRRNIDLGFLVHPRVKLRAEALSNRDTRVEVTTMHGKIETRFSRDIAELRLFEGLEPRLILLLAHLKSKLSTEKDYQGKDVRTGEAIALVQLYENRKMQFHGVPVLVGGDLNAELGSLELEMIRRSDLIDLQDILGTPPADRISYVHFDAYDRPIPQTIDYLLLSPLLRDRVVPEKSGVWRYRGFHGIAQPMPSIASERLRLPSDHYPLVVTLRI